MEKIETRSTIDWILSKPEGKQFLTACLIVISFLGIVIIRQEYRYERNVDKIQNCQEQKQDVIKKANETLLRFLLESNERQERTKEKFDSLNIQLLNLRK